MPTVLKPGSTARLSCMRNSQGFTLLEVMVAMAVLAIALAAVIDKTIESGANTSYLRDRALAHWVAENRLAEMQAMEEWREGRETGKTEFAGRQWHWEVEVQPTPARRLRRLIVRVADREGADQPISMLNGFMLDPEVRKVSGGTVPDDGDAGGVV